MPKTESVIVYDRSIDFCRLFRADSENLPPSAEVLWRGVGLRRGYDEMIRQNKNRRGVEVYRVCARTNLKGLLTFRIFKTKPADGWEERNTASTYKAARGIRTRLIAERDARTTSALSRIRGIDGSATRLTRADRLYLDWLSENRPPHADLG
jgi:hypothetical protein